MNNNLLGDLWESVENGNSIINESTFSTFVYRLIHQYSLQINDIPSGQLYTRFNTLLNTLRQSPTRANLNNLFNWIYHTFHNLNEYDAFEDYLMNPDDEEAIGVNIPVNPDGESDAELNSLWGDDEEDEQNGNGRNPYALLEQKGHEGKFTAQFKARKPQLRHLKTLGEFAHYILTHPTEFNKISKQRANYYKNLIEKKGGMINQSQIAQLSNQQINTQIGRRVTEINKIKQILIENRNELDEFDEDARELFEDEIDNLIEFIDNKMSGQPQRRTRSLQIQQLIFFDKLMIDIDDKARNLISRISHYAAMEIAKGKKNNWEESDEIPEQEEAVQLGEGRKPYALIKRKGGMFKKNEITNLKKEFNLLWNRQIVILQGLRDYILDKIERNRNLLQASQLYDEYKNEATEVIRQARQLKEKINKLKQDVSETDGMTEENKRIFILGKIGKLRELSEKIRVVKSEYDDIRDSIEPRATIANSTMGESTAFEEIPEKLLEEDRPTLTISSISPSIEVPTMSRRQMRDIPINELITALRAQNDNTNFELIRELDDIRSSSSNVPRDQQVNDALKRYGFGRPKKGGLSKKMMKDLRAYHRQVGGKISTKDFNLMLKESYKKPQDRDKHIGDYYIDESLSTPENVVYHNPKTGETKVAYRGTEGTLKDWGNNALYAFGLHNTSKRYKRSNEIQKQVEQKYGTQNLDVLGHSQSGAYAQEIGKNAKNVIVLNPATHPGYTPKTKNATVVRSKGDAVSGLKYLNPLNWGKKKTADVEIDAKTYNPVTEHMPAVLERLPEEQMLGDGRKRKRNKKLRRLCNCNNCLFCK